MSTRPAPTALSALLHDATREVHERVERASRVNRLVVVRVPAPEDAATASEREARHHARADYRDVYRAFLLAVHGFETAVDRALAGSPALGAARDSGWRPESPGPGELIRTDLASVFGEPAAAGLPAAEGFAVPRTLAEFAGMEYVRRGSRAGGAVIGAVVAHNLGFSREHGASFLLRYGRETRRELLALRAWLDALPLGPPGRDQAVASAAATFAAVERWQLALERAHAPA